MRTLESESEEAEVVDDPCQAVQVGLILQGVSAKKSFLSRTSHPDSEKVKVPPYLPPVIRWQRDLT